MNVSCYIVDDENHCIETLTDYVQKTPGLELIGSEINPLEALRKILTREVRPDVVFLDIQMPSLSGLELANLIHNETKIIITTGNNNNAHQSYDLGVLDFLLKPISYERFLKSVIKLHSLKIENYSNGNSFIFIQTENKRKFIKVNLNEVISVEGMSNYVKINTESDNIYVVYTSMKLLLEKLPLANFVRTHKSYIVNLNFVEVITGNEILMKNSKVIPIGDFFKKNLYRYL